MCAVGFFGVDGSGLDSIDFIGYTNPNKLLFESPHPDLLTLEKA